MARAVAKLDELLRTLPPYALVGGLAVSVRLGFTHRTTLDLDAVTDDQRQMVDVLVDAGNERRGDSVILGPDLKLDVLDVSEGDPEYIPFLTHRFAFDSRAAVSVRVIGESGEELATATVPTARPSALVAMKLGISEGVGRQRDPNKVGSDAFDVLRLLQRYGPEVLADELIAFASPALTDSLEWLATQHLVDGADRTAGAIVRSSVRGVERVPADQIERLGNELVRSLRRRG